MARLPGSAAMPGWADGPGLVSITRRAEELSIVCPDGRVPADVRAERGWRALEVQGPIAFQEVGVLHALTGPLARAAVSVLALATFDTDLVLVREETLARAVEALRAAGHQVEDEG
ncbi:MAG: ACT domain-containing protein [Myxococcaceae bacterium]